jgi:cell division protein FtsQ
MDRGGRVAGSLNPRLEPAEPISPASSRFARILRVVERRLPRSAEIALLMALFAVTGIYGVVRGGDGVGAVVQNIGDTAARAIGFGIDEVELVGAKQITRAEALAAAGITPTTSLLLLDAETARERLQRNPWIAEASVRKFYPGRLLIVLKERDGFAVWQRDGKLEVIARDGTVIGADARAHLREFPLVVGAGAERRAAALLNLIERFPAIRTELAAAVLVAERRWNLRLKNGIDVRLPEHDVGAALARLVVLDRETKILSRDVTAIDLRVDGRVGVRLSEDAAKERAEKLLAQKKKAADS